MKDDMYVHDLNKLADDIKKKLNHAIKECPKDYDNFWVVIKDKTTGKNLVISDKSVIDTLAITVQKY